MTNIDLTPTVSARNQFSGTVASLTQGMVDTEVTIKLDDDSTDIVAIITKSSAERLNLVPGTAVVALLRSPDVILVADETLQLSARNRFFGEIFHIEHQQINTEVTVVLPSGTRINAIISHEAAKDMDLRVGAKITAAFKSSSLILAVPKQ